ncbi:MAG: hypothetical protein DSY70_04625 [Desulfobulbus sp.]|nr:MAG: hypothetical protein DSY70_04625 [Desulfobulbus sp.]
MNRVKKVMENQGGNHLQPELVLTAIYKFSSMRFSAKCTATDFFYYNNIAVIPRTGIIFKVDRKMKDNAW